MPLAIEKDFILRRLSAWVRLKARVALAGCFAWAGFGLIVFSIATHWFFAFVFPLIGWVGSGVISSAMRVALLVIELSVPALVRYFVAGLSVWLLP